jgi:CubicO group peptidase (beta-lactamase class C family)
MQLRFIAFSTAFLGAAIPAARIGATAARSVAVSADGHARLPHIAPESAGMSTTRLALIDEVMRRGIAAGGFPGGAVVVGRRGAIVWEQGYGALDWSAGTRVNAERTMYDVASLTKVVATTAATMVLVDRGKLRLDAPVARSLPAFSGRGKGAVTIRDLLMHRSGLPAGRVLLRRGSTPASARQRVLSTPLVRQPGSGTEYSDLGLDVLGFLIERSTRERLDRFLRRSVYDPLGMHSTMFRPGPSLRSRIAPTETRVARGEVHDRNAEALGRVAGHAGLFSSAGDLAVFAQVLLDSGRAGSRRIFSDSTVSEFTRPGAGWRALGWETCSGGGSCGRYLSPRAFGHTGFTGTSMWIDPERELFVIVLTNWIHGRPGGGTAPVAVLQDVRGDIADLAALAISDRGEELAMPTRLRSELQIGWW